MLRKQQIEQAIEWLGSIPPHIQLEKIKRAYSFGSGETFSDKGKIMEVLQQTAALADTLFRENAALREQLSARQTTDREDGK